jgi:membrane-associated phospholipid phosphatase
MPSLHMAHETIMLFYSRRSSIMLLFSGLFWLSSFVAVLVLGWHYFFDVIGGGIFAGVIIAFAQFYKNVNRRLPTNDQSR